MQSRRSFEAYYGVYSGKRPRRCYHCKEWQRDHADDGRCLFDTATFLAMTDREQDELHSELIELEIRRKRV